MTQDVVSFVLRFVREGGEEQEARWRGIIKHVQSNSESHFAQFAEALEFMQSHVNPVIQSSFDEATRVSESNPFWETAHLWGESMPQYTKLMLETVKEVMGTPFAGTPVAQQVENAMTKAWSTWSLPTPAEQDKAAEQFETLIIQLTALQAKVGELEAEITRLKRPVINEK